MFMLKGTPTAATQSAHTHIHRTPHMTSACMRATPLEYHKYPVANQQNTHTHKREDSTHHKLLAVKRTKKNTLFISISITRSPGVSLVALGSAVDDDRQLIYMIFMLPPAHQCCLFNVYVKWAASALKVRVRRHKDESPAN